MDDIKAMGDALNNHQPEDLRGNSLHCGDTCAAEIVANLYDAGYLVTCVPPQEMAAREAIVQALDPLPSGTRVTVLRGLARDLG